MTTVFKVGDVVRLKYDPDAEGRRVVTEVDGETVRYEVRDAGITVHTWPASAHLLELVSRAAPPTFASCTDPGTPPACANEKPKPARLEQAKAELQEHIDACLAMQITVAGKRYTRLTSELIAAAKAEATAELNERLERADAQATAVRVALTAAGVPECEPYPDGPGLSDYDRSLRAGGRMLGAAERIARLAEREAPEPKPYGRVLATASATCSKYRQEGDDAEMTFTVRVPVHAAIACAPIHATNYRVTATSKGER